MQYLAFGRPNAGSWNQDHRLSREGADSSSPERAPPPRQPRQPPTHGGRAVQTIGILSHYAPPSNSCTSTPTAMPDAFATWEAANSLSPAPRRNGVVSLTSGTC